MIRYVKIDAKYEVSGDKDCFAFFNTVDGKFVEISGDHVFDDVEDLKEAFACDPNNRIDIGRLIGLMPNAKLSFKKGAQ